MPDEQSSPHDRRPSRRRRRARSHRADRHRDPRVRRPRRPRGRPGPRFQRVGAGPRRRPAPEQGPGEGPEAQGPGEGPEAQGREGRRGEKGKGKGKGKGPKPVELQLLAFNDYHGHLESDTPGEVDVDGAEVAAGGSEYLATHLERLRRGNRNSLTVAAGDLIGGSPFLSGLFHDEPSVETLNEIGLDVSSVGNHEFDEGVTELKRMQRGGCHPEDGCYFPSDPYDGADFPWLAANVENERGRSPLRRTWVERVRGIKVGFIGMTLEGTDQLVAQSGIQGISFLDEVETANRIVPRLRRRGVEAIVVLLHEGGFQAGSFNACEGISGPIVDIAQRLDSEIDAVITGHTHQPYNCRIAAPDGTPRPVTSAFSFGRVVTEVNLELDRRTRDVISERTRTRNHVVTQDVPADDGLSAIIAKWSALADEVGGQVVGSTSEPIERRGNRQLESGLANLIADAQLWATEGNGAQIALMNPGGVRADLDQGDVTYAEAFDVQPFGNLLSTIPMTGEQVLSVLEEQCQPPGSSRPFLFLGVSDGLTYTLDRTVAGGNCTSITVTDVRLNGVPLDPQATYQVTVNNFLVDGGDNFATFAEVSADERVGGGEDLAAFTDYLGEFAPVADPGTDRVDEEFDEGSGVVN